MFKIQVQIVCSDKENQTRSEQFTVSVSGCSRSPQLYGPSLYWSLGALHSINITACRGGLCISVLVGHVGVRGGYRDVGLWIAGVSDSGGSGGPVGIVLQPQGQVHVAHPWGLVSPTEQPGEERRAPSVIGHLGTHGALERKN